MREGRQDAEMISFLLAAAAATAPVPDMTTDWWSNLYDTPSKGIAAGELSVVVAEITVDRRGYFDGCVGRVQTGNPKMGPYVCSRLKQRALFKPARSSDGNKVIGVYRKLIVVANAREPTRFRMPQFGIRVAGSGENASHNPFEIQFYLGADGQVADCSRVEAVGINLEKRRQVVHPDLVRRACAEVPVQLKPVPPRDKKGAAMATVQNALVSIGGVVDPRNQ